MPSDSPLLAALDSAYAQQHGSFVIAKADVERHYFAQFAVNDDEVWAELVGDIFLEPEHQLAPEQHAELRARGWQFAAEGNWTRSYPGASVAAVRRQAVLDALEALGDVFGADRALIVEASLEGPATEAAEAALAARGVHASVATESGSALPVVLLLVVGGLTLIGLGLLLI